MGRIVARDELSLFGIWDELSLGTNCRFTIYRWPVWLMNTLEDELFCTIFVSKLFSDLTTSTKYTDVHCHLKKKSLSVALESLGFSDF